MYNHAGQRYNRSESSTIAIQEAAAINITADLTIADWTAAEESIAPCCRNSRSTGIINRCPHYAHNPGSCSKLIDVIE
jgi:hypothetical protein